MPQFDRTAYLYTPLFCEENIWKLVSALYTNQLAKPIDVLFLLNKTNSIALFAQNSSNINKAVIWDYHVILTAQLNSEIVVFDFDSTCNFPVPVGKYFEQTFSSNQPLTDIYQAFIKPVSAAYFIKHFYSDRAHMRGIIDDEKFPPYEIIMPDMGIKKLTLKQCRNLSLDTTEKNIYLPDDYLRQQTSV
jgi:glutamine amidase-like protein